MIVDDNTVVEPGLWPGNSNYMRVGKTENGKTIVEFLECTQFTGEHVDRAKVISRAHLANVDLVKLTELLSDRLKSIS